MQREIKFKAYVKNLKLIAPVEQISFNVETVEVDLTCGNGDTAEYEFGEIELMQYTGFKDKKGIEIYEGDICVCRKYEHIGKIKWNCDETAFYFCVACNNGIFEEEYLHYYIDELKVIGNIYENNELLK